MLLAVTGCSHGLQEHRQIHGGLTYQWLPNNNVHLLPPVPEVVFPFKSLAGEHGQDDSTEVFLFAGYLEVAGWPL